MEGRPDWGFSSTDLWLSLNPIRGTDRNCSNWLVSSTLPDPSAIVNEEDWFLFWFVTYFCCFLLEYITQHWNKEHKRKCITLLLQLTTLLIPVCYVYWSWAKLSKMKTVLNGLWCCHIQWSHKHAHSSHNFSFISSFFSKCSLL